jgi:hypothetical protein
MNLQHWIDQHPAVFVAIFPIYFLFLWLLVGATISYVGGWFSLSKFYRTRVPFSGVKWGMQSGRMRWLGELQQRVNDGSQSAGFLFGQRVPFSVHAPSTPCSVERDQGAKEQGLGVRVHNPHDGT